MKEIRKKPAANLRSWRVIITRSKGEYLGSVEAPDRERAEGVATLLAGRLISNGPILGTTRQANAFCDDVQAGQRRLSRRPTQYMEGVPKCREQEFWRFP